MKNPFFSIIIVSLNAEQFINKTITSIINQSYDDYEVIIKDGMSADNTLSIIPQNPKIKVHIKADSSIYDAMNQAIDLSAGEYIIFMNCGDEFADSEVLSNVALQLDDRYGMIYGNYIRDSIVHKQPEKLSRFYMYRTPLCHQTVFFNGNLLRDTIRYDLRYKILGDYDLELNILEKENTKYVDFAICTYLGGGVSESENGIKIKSKERKEILRKHYSRTERIKNMVLRELTFPYLRNKIASSGTPNLRRMYQKIVNIINR